MFRCSNMSRHSTLRTINLFSEKFKNINLHTKGASTVAKNIDLWNSAKPFSAIPGFSHVPFFGSLWVYMPFVGHYSVDRHHIATKDKRRRFGDVFKDKLGNIQYITSCRAEDMETVLCNEGKFPTRGSLFDSQRVYRESREELFNNKGLFLEEGKIWHELRSRCQKYMLRSKTVESYIKPVQGISKDFLKRMLHFRNEKNEIPHLNHELNRFATEAITYIAMDSRLGMLELDVSPDLDTAKVTKCVLDVFTCLNKLEGTSGNIEYWRYFRTPTWKKYEKACDVFYQLAYKHVQRSIKVLRKAEITEDTEMTLLQQLVTKEGLEAKDVMVILFDMVIAGVETTGYTLVYLLYLLGKNPQKQDLLRKEIDQFLPNKNHALTADIYNQLRYVKACVKETLRLFPVTIGVPRKLNRDCVIGGYQVPAGTYAAISHIDIFRDARYFSDAEKFVPERFLTREKDSFNPFAYTPFGIGVRSCVGRRFAEMEIVCLAAEIFRNFKVEYHHEDLDFFTRIVNEPDRDLRVTFIDR